MRLANEGDETAKSILAEIGRYLGSGMGSFANIFEPDLIVIGGGFGVAGLGMDRPSCRRGDAPGSAAPDARRVRIVPAELGTAAGLDRCRLVAFEALDAA